MNLFEFQLLKHSATGQSFLGNSLDLQTTLHDLAGRFLVLIKRVGVDIQRGGRLAVTQQTCHRGYVRTVRDQETGIAVAEGMHIELLRQAVLFQDQLESPCEGGRRHGKLVPVSAEHIIILGQLSVFIVFRLPVALVAVLFQ